MLIIAMLAACTGGTKDTGSASCEDPTDLSGTIADATTLTRVCSPYTVTADLDVQGDVTAEAGVEVDVADGAQILVSTGSLTTEGTADAPVRILGSGHGTWRGIEVDEQGSASLAGTEIAGGGRVQDDGSWAGLTVASPDVSLSGVEVHDSGWFAIALEAPLASAEDVTVGGADGEDPLVGTPVYAALDALGGLPTLTLEDTDASAPAVYLDTCAEDELAITEDTTWASQPQPIASPCTNSLSVASGTLTIASNELLLTSDVSVADGAAIAADGVTFDALDPTLGWAGINLAYVDLAAFHLDGVTLAHARGIAYEDTTRGGNVDTAIVLEATDAGEYPTITNTTIRDMLAADGTSGGVVVTDPVCPATAPYEDASSGNSFETDVGVWYYQSGGC